MPARLNPRQDERSRSAIQTTQLCKRLNRYALDLPDPATGRKFEMSDGQIRAALGLLRKTLPDLAVMQLEGGNTPLVCDFRWADEPQPLPVIEAKPESDSVAEASDAPLVTWAGE